MAIRGNTDRGDWAKPLPETLAVELGAVRIFVLHDAHALTRDPPPAGTQIVVCGHSHKPLVEERPGFLLVNPGSAGPRRFKLPVTAGEIVVDAQGRFDVKIAPLL